MRWWNVLLLCETVSGGEEEDGEWADEYADQHPSIFIQMQIWLSSTKDWSLHMLHRETQEVIPANGYQNVWYCLYTNILVVNTATLSTEFIL